MFEKFVQIDGNLFDWITWRFGLKCTMQFETFCCLKLYVIQYRFYIYIYICRNCFSAIFLQYCIGKQVFVNSHKTLIRNSEEI